MGDPYSMGTGESSLLQRNGQSDSGDARAISSLQLRAVSAIHVACAVASAAEAAEGAGPAAAGRGGRAVVARQADALLGRVELVCVGLEVDIRRGEKIDQKVVRVRRAHRARRLHRHHSTAITRAPFIRIARCREAFDSRATRGGVTRPGAADSARRGNAGSTACVESE